MYNCISELECSLLGRPVVIIGGGPSAKDLPSNFIEDKITIGCNYRIPRIRCDYHVLHDPLAVMWYKKNNLDLTTSSLILSHLTTQVDRHNSYKYESDHGWPEHEFSLNPHNMRDVWVGDIPVKEYLNTILIEWEELDKPHPIYQAMTPCPSPYDKSNELLVGEGWTNTGVWCIELAIYMGVDKIYLSGFDGGLTHHYAHYASDRLDKGKNRDRNFYMGYNAKMQSLRNKVEIVLLNTSDSVYSHSLDKINI